jgi:hypothetical protein
MKFIAEILLTSIALLIPAGSHSRQIAEQSDACSAGLHAGIHAQIQKAESGPPASSPYVMLTFVLLNDGDAPVNSIEGAWKLYIDDTVQPDSDSILFDGIQPIGGFGTLKPGESYQFSKGLPIQHYFPDEGEHKVYWTGKGFRSSTITVAVTSRDDTDAVLNRTPR